MLDMVEASIGFVPLVVWMPRFFKSLERTLATELKTQALDFGAKALPEADWNRGKH